MATSPASRLPRRNGEESRTLLLSALRARKAVQAPDPTISELAEATGLGKSTIRHHLAWLEAHGVIRIGEPRRQIELLDDPGEALP